MDLSVPLYDTDQNKIQPLPVICKTPVKFYHNNFGLLRNILVDVQVKMSSLRHMLFSVLDLKILGTRSLMEKHFIKLQFIWF